MTLERGRGITIPGEEGGKGKAKGFWPNVHIEDLARLYLEVIESALEEMGGGAGKATWGSEGYYFAENGVHYWQDVAGAIAEEGYKQGFLEKGVVEGLGGEEWESVKEVGPAIWNVGASCRYVRAKKLFGWEPKEKRLMEEIAEVVRSEAERGASAKRA